MHSNVSVVNNKARLDLVFNAPEQFWDQSILNNFHQQMLIRANDFGWDAIDAKISVTANRMYKFDSYKIN